MADTYTVQRSATIPAEPSAVYERIADFHRWEAWSPWEDLDPAMDKTFGGPDRGVGATYAWSGNRKAGAGSMAITSVEPDRKVDIALEFTKPFKSKNQMEFILEPVDGGTKVDMVMTAPHSLMTRVMGIFMSMDKMVGKDFEKGLAQLRDDVAR